LSRPAYPDRVLREARELEVREGSLPDYQDLKRFHYMDGRVGDLPLDPADVVSIRSAFFRGRLIGVRVFTKMFPARSEALSLFKTINEQAVLSSRVIVHPAFRGLGVSKLMDLPPEARGRFRKIFTHSALAVHFPFDRAGGYRVAGHVSRTISPEQDRFVAEALDAGLAGLEDLNDPARCRAFWERVPLERRARLRELAAAALADYDARYTLSVLGELNLPTTDRLESGLRLFFKKGLDAVPLADSWKLLGEAVPFPMEGLVKDL
jgi:hypothetical protein